MNSQLFKSFHCRGSSGKEKIDTNHKLMIFVHHGNKLYSAVKLNKDGLEIPKLKELSTISSHKLYFVNESKFLFLENIYDEDDKSKVIE